MQRTELLTYIDDLLKPHQVKDYCPNGLQVAGNEHVKKIVTGVTACQALLDAAVAANADTVLVHHGYFWKGENPCITGIKRARLTTLLTHNINLLAYHLPLDVHPEIGNNAQLAEVLEITVTEVSPDGLIYAGELSQSLSAPALSTLLQDKLKRAPQLISGHNREIKRIAWCTGAAQDYLEAALAYNVDAFISGEVSERTFHLAKEYGINYYAAGHHATERFGIQALGEVLAEKFAVEVEFIDIDNPV
jgi:dinuclear metal center YbgI/SA1388 family protein